MAGHCSPTLATKNFCLFFWPALPLGRVARLEAFLVFFSAFACEGTVVGRQKGRVSRGLYVPHVKGKKLAIRLSNDYHNKV
jgi:hypothetical protein